MTSRSIVKHKSTAISSRGSFKLYNTVFSGHVHGAPHLNAKFLGNSCFLSWATTWLWRPFYVTKLDDFSRQIMLCSSTTTYINYLSKKFRLLCRSLHDDKWTHIQCQCSSFWTDKTGSDRPKLHWAPNKSGKCRCVCVRGMFSCLCAYTCTCERGSYMCVKVYVRFDWLWNILLQSLQAGGCVAKVWTNCTVNKSWRDSILC